MIYVLSDLTIWVYFIRIVLGVAILYYAIPIWNRYQFIPTLMACLVMMVFSQVLVDSFHLYTRAAKLLGHLIYHEITKSIWWSFRLVPEALVLIYALYHTRRIYYSPKDYS